MRWLRSFTLGLVLALVVAGLAAAAFVAYGQLSHGPSSAQPVPASPAAAGSSPSSTPVSTTDEQVKGRLLAWQSSGIPPGAIKSQVLDTAIDYFARQTGVEPGKLRQRISLLAPSEYNGKSASYCDDSKDIRTPSEAWLLDIRGDALFVNDGFTAATNQTPADLFFRYTIGLFNLAPELKSYPAGVKTGDGTTAYFEKGLVLLGRRTLDQVLNTSCFLQYRRPLQDGYTADRALTLLSRLGVAPSAGYDYPQKANLQTYRAKLAPRLGSRAGDLLEPFLKTDSGEFYRRAGKALGATGDAQTMELAADKAFREAFPTS